MPTGHSVPSTNEHLPYFTNEAFWLEDLMNLFAQDVLSVPPNLLFARSTVGDGCDALAFAPDMRTRRTTFSAR